ncbi:Vacuolar protein 8 [Coemansia nantahalensis]|uniref:Vacuolar protein 8 n=1 Tax=Coemansia nantahalensis TaxID=2789366 RepID=A0ACC1K5M7_9FUNG|nr:Vacuolar protein 8 [Coemansia nantahalensis]
MGAGLSFISGLHCCGDGGAHQLYSSFDDDCSDECQPLLGDRERRAVASLVRLFEKDMRISFYDGEPLRALTVLAHSNIQHLQLSAATAFSEISEYDVRAVSRGALGPILHLLQSEHPDIQQGAARALGNLAAVAENKRLVVAMGGLEVLVRLMTSPSTDAQISSVGCITNLAADDDSKLAIAQSGALVPLTQLARSRDVRVRRNATGALLNMTHQAGLRRLVVDAGAVAALVDLLDAGDEDTRYYAITALSNIAADDPGRSALWEAAPGLVGALLHATAAPKIRIQAQAALTLRNLASDGRYQQAIVSHGGLGALLPLVQSPYTALVTSATACLRNLSIHPGNEEPIVGAGLLPDLIDLVAQMDQPELQCHAIATVRNLVANSGTDKQVYVDAGLFGSLRVVLSSKDAHSTVLREAAAALGVLVLNDRLWRPVVEQGLCQLLVHAMHAQSMDAEYNASLAIGTLVGRGQPVVFEGLLRVWQQPAGGLRGFLARALTHPDYVASNVRPVAVWVAMTLFNDGGTDFKEAIAADKQLLAAIADIGQAPPPAIFSNGGRNKTVADDADGGRASSIPDNATAADECPGLAPAQHIVGVVGTA